MANSNYNAALPKYEWGYGWMKGDVSEAQAKFIAALAEQTGVSVLTFEGMKKGHASNLIEELKRKASGDPHSDRYLARDYSEFVQTN